LIECPVNLCMHLKIYFNTKPLFITAQPEGEIADYLHQRETIMIDELSHHGVRTMIHELQQPDYIRGVFLHPDPEAVLRAFEAEMTPIQAGGGFVVNEEGEVLFIFRRGRWDLPKGKLDEGETIEDCALREVEEETGLKQLSPGRLLLTTYHTYHQDGQHMLKASWWYLMHTSRQDLKPQTEEDIEKCEWVKPDAIPALMDLTHGSIRDVVAAGLQAIKA
jgi:8-oxo-dGTP pyrophosphatase MutT (NUDIX family)